MKLVTNIHHVSGQCYKSFQGHTSKVNVILCNFRTVSIRVPLLFILMIWSEIKNTAFLVYKPDIPPWETSIRIATNAATACPYHWDRGREWRGGGLTLTHCSEAMCMCGHPGPAGAWRRGVGELTPRHLPSGDTGDRRLQRREGSSLIPQKL